MELTALKKALLEKLANAKLTKEEFQQFVDKAKELANQRPKK